MKNKKELNKLHDEIIKTIIPHATAQLRQIEGYDTPGNLKCSRCKRPGAKRNRQRTSYVDEESNWATLCPDCQEEADEYWKGMWEDYYSSRL